MRALVLGVGNPILSDDGVGIHVARALKEKGLRDVEVEELPAGGLELLDLVLDHEVVVIVDAIQTSGGTPGQIHELEEKDFEKAVHGSSPHGINIATALALGRRLVPDRMPRTVKYVAIEAADLVNVGEKLTPPVHEAMHRAVALVEEMLTVSRS